MQSRQDIAQGILHDAGFKSEILHTSAFPLFMAAQVAVQAQLDQPLVVVIEGDGYAWVNRYTLSDDPTPKNPIGLYLATAIADSGRHAVYLGRPCQYVRDVGSAFCQPSIWSTRRFGAGVLASYMEALDQLSMRTGAKQFHLVGFSGGAYIALILAAQRDDVAQMTSVAGLLDPDVWSAHHDISPLEVLYAPSVLLRKTASTRFEHICSPDDDVIPCALTDGFVQKARALGLDNHKVSVFSGESHHSLWRKVPMR